MMKGEIREPRVFIALAARCLGFNVIDFLAPRNQRVRCEYISRCCKTIGSLGQEAKKLYMININKLYTISNNYSMMEFG